MKHTISLEEARQRLEAADLVILVDSQGRWVVTRFEYYPLVQRYIARSDVSDRSMTFEAKAEKETISIEGNEISRVGTSVKLLLYQAKALVLEKAEP